MQAKEKEDKRVVEHAVQEQMDSDGPDTGPSPSSNIFTTADVDSAEEFDHNGQRHLLQTPKPAPFTRHVLLAASMASLGGILFGYDLGIISGALLQLRCEFSLSDIEKEWVVSTMLVGALIASLTAGFLIDYFGRRRVIIVNACLFILGAVILAASPSFGVLIFGRLVVGYGISVAAISETVYIAEISPPDKRGRLVTLNELGIVLGFLLSYIIGYGFVHIKHGWRYMFALSTIPAAIQGFGRIFLPSSPRYLMLTGKVEQVKECLRKLRGHYDVDQEVDEIQTSLAAENELKTSDLLHCGGVTGRRLLIGSGLVFLQQMTGQPTILYYAPVIFESLGFSSRNQSTLAALALGSVKFICACIVLLIMDRVGRRRLLLSGVAVMTVSMVLLSAVLNGELKASPPEQCKTSYVNTTNTTDEVTNNRFSMTAKWLSLFGLLGYVAAYQFGFGACSWVILSEIYPSMLRGRAVAWATSLNWATNLLISAVFLDLKNALSIAGLFLAYAVVCIMAFLFVFFSVPETKNRTLEAISRDFDGMYTSPRHRLAEMLWICRLCGSHCSCPSKTQSYSMELASL